MSAHDSPIFIQNEWTIGETYFDPSQVVTTGSNFMTGNGYLGYRGTFPDWGSTQYVGCIVTDTYDKADGKWKELCNVPNGLRTRLFQGDQEVSLTSPVDEYQYNPTHDYSLSLNYRYGRTAGSFSWKSPKGQDISLSFERFASYDKLHLVAQRIRCSAPGGGKISLLTGIDGDIWSLNGDHFREYSPFLDDGVIGILAHTTEKQLPVAVAQSISISGVEPEISYKSSAEHSTMRLLEFELSPDEEVVIEQMMTVFTGNDVPNPQEEAVRLARETIRSGFSEEAELSARVWDTMWNRYDIQIGSSDDSQALLRYNLYHNIIATPAHTDHLPIGARGLSCQAYQGAAFWDQEIFNLPMYLYTNPQAARNILIYRYKTLDGARRKAGRLGYEGAYYAWISGDTGDELCPDYFFKDVLTGRKIRNHFNDWQIHISPDIAYTIQHYYRATGDWDFMRDYGAEMLFEIANFLVSKAYFKKTSGRYEILRVLGPDEYHENVDNNTFTNVQAQRALEAALEVYRRLDENEPDLLADLAKRSKISTDRIQLWKEMHELLFIPEADDDSKVIPQFSGYFQLEDSRPEELEKRLLDENEYWGWPNGVALETQVIKQADVIQLFCLHPDLYDTDTMRRNYLYYEPRSHHRSSLSPAVHSIVAAKIGLNEQAYQYFRKSLTIDLYNTNTPASGGTFIGGIHTAACGIAWQMMVFGFAGIDVREDGIVCRPNLPEQWKSLNFSLIFHAQHCQFSFSQADLKIEAAYSNTEAVPVTIGSESFEVGPGKSIERELPAPPSEDQE